jgi:hypothetical protein
LEEALRNEPEGGVKDFLTCSGMRSECDSLEMGDVAGQASEILIAMPERAVVMQRAGERSSDDTRR